MKYFISIIISLLSTTTSCQITKTQYCHNQQTELAITDDFETSLNLSRWFVEMDSLPGSNVYTSNGKLILDTKGGVTIWLKQKLSGNYQINYTRKVVVESGKNDRLSDMNQFWMANDLNNSNLFTRKGKFEEYDNLQLYYTGIGGNTNTTTRLRRYDGKGNRQLIAEWNDTPHLLKPNYTYHIKIVVKDGESQFWVDDTCYFTFKDPHPFTSGYFGFRSTWSHQEIDDFKVTTLK